MASSVPAAAATGGAAAPARNLGAERRPAAATAAASAAKSAAMPTELKSEPWPYPLKLPSFPLDFELLQNPKLFIFHDSCGHPLVRYYWPASTAKAAASSTKKETSTSSVRARAVVVLVHDQGTHTVFDWLKNAPLSKNKKSPTGAPQEPAGLLSPVASIERTLTPDPFAALSPLNTVLDSSEISDTARTTAGDTDRTDILSAIAAEAKKLFSDANTRERKDEAALGGEREDTVAAAAEAAAATVAAATPAPESVASLLPAEPLFRDLPQKPLHAVRTACYEGSWVELFNAAGFDVYAVDLLQHGLSALVERQQQRQRKRRGRHQKKEREAAADGGDYRVEEDEQETPFSFDLLAEDLCCMLDDISRFSTLPVFLLGQGTGATVAARAAELLAKKGKLGKPHLPRSATDTAAQATDDRTAVEELCIDPLTSSSEIVATSPLLAGVRHIGRETILPVQHVVVQSRPIPLAGLVLLSPVLQLRESVALEQTTTTAAAAKREERLHQKHSQQQREGPSGLAEGRRLSGESHISEVEQSTSAEEDEKEKLVSDRVGSGKEKGSSWNVFSWLLGSHAEPVRAKPAADQGGVRLRRRRHSLAHQYVLLPSLNVEEERGLEEEKNFDALYEKSYFRDRLTIKTLLPCAQLVELRKGISRTLTEARWLLIPIERDSRQLVTAATWQEQYQKWKKTIARRVRETCLRGGISSKQLLHQESVLSGFSEDPLKGDDIPVDLAPWLQPETPAMAVADAASVATRQIATAEAQKTGSLAQTPKQEEEEDEVQQEPEATEAEIRRRKQLKRMHMAFYLKVLVVQGMTASQEIAYQCCGCHPTYEALPADREVECFAEASDLQGVVSFYRSLGGKASVARRILVHHGQLPLPKRKKASSRGMWLSKGCRDVVDEGAAAATLAAIAAAEAAQTDSLALVDVGSEEQRMGEDPDWDNEDEADEAAEEDDETDVSEASGEEYTYGRSIAAEGKEFGITEGTAHEAATALSAGSPSSTAQTQGRTSPLWMLPPARTGDSGYPRVAAEGAAVAAAAEGWIENDSQSDAALKARFYALEEERRLLDENLRLLNGDVQSPAEARAEEAAAAARKEVLPLAMRRNSSLYKSVYERDLQRYGTVVRLPDRSTAVGQTKVTAADLCKNFLLRQCEGTSGGIRSVLNASSVAEASLSADNERVEGPRVEELEWIKEYPVSWQGCQGGVMLPYACVQSPCEVSARVRITEKVKAPVQVVEKIYMHEATDALRATIAEIQARESQQKGGGIAAIADESRTGEESDLLGRNAGSKLAGGADRLASEKPRKLRLRDVRSWRRVGAIVVDGKGTQVPLEQVEELRVKFPREYVNLFLYGATCEATANLAGEAASVDPMQRRQVTMWLLPQVHHSALCQGDEGNKIGNRILNDWLLPALQDLQRSEAVWHGSQVRSQLRKQLSKPGALPRWDQ